MTDMEISVNSSMIDILGLQVMSHWLSLLVHGYGSTSFCLSQNARKRNFELRAP